jgi:hypothetical protein
MSASSSAGIARGSTGGGGGIEPDGLATSVI